MQGQDEELEDYGTLEIGDNEEHEKEEKAKFYPNMPIKIDKDQYSVFEMKRKFDKEKICMDPSFQRNFVWSEQQKSELIESVIMGIPLPLLYLAESQQGELIVVDGRQRLTTFFDFLDNKFKLSKLRIMRQLNGKNFAALEKEYANYASTIEDYQLVVQIIKYPTPDRVRFDIFDRVNRGGTPLNKQEMRNALYQGNATVLLKKITENSAFLQATGNGISSKHMKDRYIALRAIAFTLLYTGELKDLKGNIIEYKSDIEDFLGKTMEYLNNCNMEQMKALEDKFNTVMENIYLSFGENAFRIPGSDKRKRPISMTLFETLFYLYYLLLDYDIQYAKVSSKFNLMQDTEFLRALQHSVDSSYSVEKRFSKMKEWYREILND